LHQDINVKDLVRWIVLTDQWPYRTAYIVQVIEDANQRQLFNPRERISEESSLYHLYRYYFTFCTCTVTLDQVKISLMLPKWPVGKTSFWEIWSYGKIIAEFQKIQHFILNSDV